MIEKLVREPDVAGVIQVCVRSHVNTSRPSVSHSVHTRAPVFPHAPCCDCTRWCVNLRIAGPCE